MSEELRCEAEFDDFVMATTEWVEKQKELLEKRATPEDIEEVTELYEEMIRKGKRFARCEGR